MAGVHEGVRQIPTIARSADVQPTAVPLRRRLNGVRPAGLEPATHSLEGCCSIHLSYGRVLSRNNLDDLVVSATAFVTGFVAVGRG